jgi:hypothetical protein
VAVTPYEQLTNSASTTLTATYNVGDPSFTVASVAGFPTSGIFRVRIDDEIIKVTSINTGTKVLTATKAAEAVNGVTTSAQHLIGATVRLVATAASIVQVGVDRTQAMGGANYTFYADSAGYYGRNEISAVQTSTSTSAVDVVVNACTKESNNNRFYNGSGNGFWDDFASGGVFNFTRPVGGGTLDAVAPLFVYTGQTFRGGGRGVRIRATGGWTAPTETNGLGALVSAGYGTDLGDTTLRVNLENLTLDCNHLAGGILYRRNLSGSTINPGAAGKSNITNCEIYGFKAYGIDVGITNGTPGTIDATQTGSSNLWIDGNFVRDGEAGSKAFVNHTGDVHLQFNNFVQDRQAGSYCMYIDELGVHARNNHIGWQGSTVRTPNANIYVHSGSGSAFVANYVDNAGDNGQAACEVASGANSVLFAVNHVNWGDSNITEFPSAKAAVYVSSAKYVRVIGNRLNGNVNATYLGSIYTGAPIARFSSGNSADTGSLTGNSGRGVSGFFTVGGGATLQYKPATFGGNQIFDQTAAAGAGLTQSDTLMAGAGAPPTTIGTDVLQLVHGLEYTDVTNMNKYTYFSAAGAWKGAHVMNSPFTDTVRGVTGAIATNVNTAHGLGVTPAGVIVTPLSAGPLDVYVDTIGSTNFKIQYAGGGTATFAWTAWA